MIKNTSKQDEKVLRQTQSLCPRCSIRIPARIIQENGSVYMKKECPAHGSFSLRITKHAWYYRQLTDYYFAVMPAKMKQKRFYIYFSNKCNLNCPVCLLEPNQGSAQDITLDEFRKVIENNSSARFYIYGAEPTLRPDLIEWITLLKQYGNMVNMHTNGIRLTDYSYLKELRDAGVDYISMQFDGFDDRVYRRLRGTEQYEIKMQALANLKKLGIPTGCNVTLARGINEDQIAPILDYALKNPFIRDVSFATLSHLGDAMKNFSQDTVFMPDELIDLVEEATGGRIARSNFYAFQKFYYAVLSLLNVRRCYNFQHLALVREGEKYRTFDALFGLKRFERHLDTYRSLLKRNKLQAAAYLLSQGVSAMPGADFIQKLKCMPLNMLIPGQARSPKIPERLLMVSVGTVCDPYKYDAGISRYCGQGFCVKKGDEVVLSDSISEVTLGQR